MVRPVMAFSLLLACTSVTNFPDQDDVVLALIEASSDANGRVRSEAIRSLAKIAPDSSKVASVLQKAAKDKDQSVRKAALEAAVECLDVEITVRLLIDALSDDDQIAFFARQELARIGEPAVPQLIQALDKKETRLTAIRALWDFGIKAKTAAPSLVEALKDEDHMVRACAAHCLGSIFSRQSQTRQTRKPSSR